MLTEPFYCCLGEYVSPFYEGVAAVSLGSLWGYIYDTAA